MVAIAASVANQKQIQESSAAAILSTGLPWAVCHEKKTMQLVHRCRPAKRLLTCC